MCRINRSFLSFAETGQYGYLLRKLYEELAEKSAGMASGRTTFL